MKSWRGIVVIFCLMVATALWADTPKSISAYQGAWVRDAVNPNALSKIVIVNPHHQWLVEIYQYCQEKNNCLIAHIPIRVEESRSGGLERMTAFWQKKFPQAKHIILLYEIILTPQDSQRLRWQIVVRDERTPSQLVMTMQGALSRSEIQPSVQQLQPAQTDRNEKPKAPAKVAICPKLKVDCVLVKDPSTIVGKFSVDQTKVDDNKVSRCLPWQLKNYNAKNIALLFKLNNNVCVQKFSAKCANLQCAAVIRDFKKLGKVLADQSFLSFV